MEAVPQIGLGSARGRKDGQQEAALTLGPVNDQIGRLVRLKIEAKEASELYTDEVKRVAAQSGFLAKNLNSYVSARASEKLEERRRDWEQLSLLGSEIA